MNVLDIEVRPETISKGLMQAIGMLSIVNFLDFYLFLLPGIARIFLRTKAKIIILNDAEGAMDALKLREIVFPNLWNFVDKNNILLVVISKNYSAIRELDCILVFDTTTGMLLLHYRTSVISLLGLIVHSGTHKELLRQQAKLYIEFMFPWKAIPDTSKKKNDSNEKNEVLNSYEGTQWLQ